MALNDISFRLQEGGLNRAAASQDGISCLMSMDTAPVGYGTDKVRKYKRLKDAEADGITDASFPLLHYQVSEFFRIAAGQELYIAFSATVEELIAASAGTIRQLGVWGQVSEVSDYQDDYATKSIEQHSPFVIVFGVYDTDPINLSTIPDFNGSPDNGAVGVLAAGDFANRGAALAVSQGVDYVPAVGAVLGATAKARVHESIAWVDKFNLAEFGGELEQIALADGTNAYADTTVLDDLDAKRYLILRKHVGIQGTYLNDSHTATSNTSDYAYIENNRTVQKALRGIRNDLLPSLNSPIQVEGSTGKIETSQIKYLERVAQQSVQQMVNDEELSAQDVYIDPDQDILSSSELLVEVSLVPYGTARNIKITLGFATSV